MTDLTQLNAQVADTITVMAKAVDTIKEDVAALAAAHAADDSAAVGELVAKLHAGTDALAAAMAPVVPAPAPAVEPAPAPAPEAPAAQ